MLETSLYDVYQQNEPNKSSYKNLNDYMPIYKLVNLSDRIILS